jgi:hypothetical protein
MSRREVKCDGRITERELVAVLRFHISLRANAFGNGAVGDVPVLFDMTTFAPK